MKHIIIYLAIALVMFGLLGWYFAQQEDLQPKALQAELSVSNVAKLPQQKVEMLFSDMSNEEKNSFRIAIQNELGAAVDVAAHDCMGSAEVQMTYAKKVLEQGCTVLMLEPVNDTVTDEVARRYLSEFDDKNIDALILGCTHYPLLTDVIGDVMGPGVELVSAGEESAFELKRMLKARELRADEHRRGETEFYVSDRVEDFERTASLFLQEDLRHTARRIDIERY